VCRINPATPLALRALGLGVLGLDREQGVSELGQVSALSLSQLMMLRSMMWWILQILGRLKLPLERSPAVV
jgi:hypothetical protein